ncbi:MAG: hypothetical protein HRU34_21435 [Richelia sp.]|nr:hypothetical protein [Richelia sp.]
METDYSKHPSNGGGVPNATNTGKRRLLLIPRSKRRWFFVQFTLATIIGWVLGGIASIFFESNLINILPTIFFSQPQTWSTIATNISVGLFGLIFAICQALVIFRYLSFWWWTLATSFGWFMFLNVGEGWKNYILNSALAQSLSPNEMVRLGILSTIAYNLAAVWLGVLQWLVIRPKVIRAWGWIFLPSGAFFSISLFIWFVSLLQEFIPEVNRTQILYLSGQGLTAVILGILPAIALCNCKIHTQGIPKISHSSSEGRSDQG